ncbi:MAG: tetratricopeptide repeat protein [Verrucomicrobia bacterium]|nr:tetratricopeptide repeat protein [Verrucomicrobiota bacterium]
MSLMLWGCVQVPVDARALINAGYAAALKGDAATTRQHYEKALAAEPGAKGHRVSYGWALFNLKLFDEALQQWRQAYAGVDHDAANIEVCLALACHRTGRKAEALEWYAKQVARDERFGEAAGVAFVTSHWRALEQETLRALFEDFSRRSAPK